MPAIPPPEQNGAPGSCTDGADLTSQSEQTAPTPLSYPTPLLRFKIQDLSSNGAKRFLHSIDAATILTSAIHTVLDTLTPKQEGTPNVRSITLVLRDFPGVAYTAGKDIDFEHKEIHLSTSYIEDIQLDRSKSEITGVLVHEMVHVWQWNGCGECNSGLIEGVADWVRLKAGLGPPHWKRRAKDCKWDDGYDVTGYFLESLEEKFGKDIVVKINQKLREKYVEARFWKEMFEGKDVNELWESYASELVDAEPEDDKKQEAPEEATAQQKER
ncbi:MAG: hypothetical protein Q9165_003945 [Trypethelium subeluteriae]